jgi:hypothetical protein
MVPRAGMIKQPAGEGRFALHASRRLPPGYRRDRRRRNCNTPIAADDDAVNAGNTIRFKRRFRQGFFLFAATGNGIVAIFTAGLW